MCVVFRLQDDVQLTSECKEGKSESNAEKRVTGLVFCVNSFQFCVSSIEKSVIAL